MQSSKSVMPRSWLLVPKTAALLLATGTKRVLPFVGLPDPDHTVANRYGQEVKLLKMGRMPAMMVIDKMGEIIYVHYADSMKDIPANSEVLAVLDERNQEVAAAFGATIAPERAGQSTKAIMDN